MLQPSSLLAVLLLALCLCILALRVTYTEAPTAQTIVLTGSLFDTIYSLTLSGLLLFAFAGWLVRRFASNQQTYRVTGMEIGLVALLAAAILGTVGSSDKRAAINQTVILLGPAVAALLLAQILDGPGRIRVVLIVLVALGIVSAYQCAEQFLVSNAVTVEQYEKDPKMLLEPLGIEPGTFQHFLFEHRLYSRGIRGFFTTSNSAASFAICASFAAIALLAGKLRDIKARRQEVRYAVLTLLAATLLVAGLFLTQSKGGIVAFLAGLGVFGLLMLISRRCGAHKRRVLIVLFSSMLLLIVAAGCVAVLYGLKHGRLPGGNSMLVRWQYWVASTRMYADHALAGVGPGNFADYYPHYKPGAALESIADPHNWPLSLITQFGPLGLVGFLAMVGLALWRWISSARPNPGNDMGCSQPASRALVLIMLAVITSCLLLVRPLLIPMSGSDDPDVQLYEIITLFVTPAAAFLIGFLLVATPLRQDPPTQLDLPASALSASLVSAILAVLLHGLIDFAIFEPGVWMTFWVLLACLVALRPRPEPERVFGKHPSQGTWPPSRYKDTGWQPQGRRPWGWLGTGCRQVPMPKADHPQAALEAGVPQRGILRWGAPATRKTAASHAPSDRGDIPHDRSPRLGWLAGGVAIALLGAYVHWVWMPVYGMTMGIQKAQHAISIGRFDQAHEFLEAAVQADRLSPAAANLNGRLYSQRYESAYGGPRGSMALLEEATRCFREAVARSPADYKNYEKLGLVYSRLGRPQEAYDWYRKAAGLYPGRERIWFELGQLAERLGRTEAARDYYARAVEIEDSYREQFRRMYPERQETVSRLGEKEYRLAQERIAKLTAATAEPEGLTTQPPP